MAQFTQQNTSPLNIENPLEGYTSLYFFNDGAWLRLNDGSNLLIGPYTLIEVTYTDLIQLISTNSLKPGGGYKIVDYRTRHQIPYTTDINEGSIEPLIVTALTTNTISSQAWSEIWPQDIIEYTIDNTYITGATTGVIIFRHDKFKNIKCHYDFRVVRYRRWRIDMSSYQLTNDYWLPLESVSNAVDTFNATDSNDYVDYLTFNSNDPDILNVSIEKYQGVTTNISRGYYSPVMESTLYKWYLPNIVIRFSVENIKIGTDCTNLTIFNANSDIEINYADLGFINTINRSKIDRIAGSTINTLSDSKIFLQDSYISEISNTNISVITSNVTNSIINSNINSINTSTISFLENMEANNISNSNIDSITYSTLEDISDSTITSISWSNIGTINNSVINTISQCKMYGILNSNINSMINSEFYNFNNNIVNNIINTKGGIFISNILNNNMTNNIILGDFTNNTINGQFSNNTISVEIFDSNLLEEFKNNKINCSIFIGNTMSTGSTLFNNNIIDDNFVSNQIIGNFINLHIKTSISSINFTPGTYVAANYSKDIIKRSDNVLRLVYVDSSDVLNYVSITV